MLTYAPRAGCCAPSLSLHLGHVMLVHRELITYHHHFAGTNIATKHLMCASSQPLAEDMNTLISCREVEPCELIVPPWAVKAVIGSVRNPGWPHCRHSTADGIRAALHAIQVEDHRRRRLLQPPQPPASCDDESVQRGSRAPRSSCGSWCRPVPSARAREHRWRAAKRQSIRLDVRRSVRGTTADAAPAAARRAARRRRLRRPLGAAGGDPRQVDRAVDDIRRRRRRAARVARPRFPRYGRLVQRHGQEVAGGASCPSLADRHFQIADATALRHLGVAASPRPR